MRGTVPERKTIATIERITPAHAGNRHGTSSMKIGNGDHPRACGEQMPDILQNVSIPGSPPRMRGTAQRPLAVSDLFRITPAHAGNRIGITGRIQTGRDHPRACGEQCFPTQHLCSSRGSPPRMRGTVAAMPRVSSYPGITPAHAGNSDTDPFLILLNEDHPRACGEQQDRRIRRHFQKGSPPRMRGTACEGVIVPPPAGITPAHAGNSTQEMQKNSGE